MESSYPFFDTKGIDWVELSGRYEQEVALVTEDGDYWRIVARMLAELHDGHTGLLSPSVMSGRYTFATCIDLDGILVVDQVGSVARLPGWSGRCSAGCERPSHCFCPPGPTSHADGRILGSSAP